MTIAALGLWHQGVVGAACLVDMGHEVKAADVDGARIEKLNRGEAPLFEPGLNELLKKGLASKRLSFTASYAEAVRGAEYVFFMFDTPVNDNDESDLTEILRCAREIAPVLSPDAIVLVTSQVPVGTSEAIAEILGKGHAAKIAYIPENLRLGQAISRFMSPPLPVIGCDDAAVYDKLLKVFGPLSSGWQRVSLRTAEMLKHALNSYLALTICFANELGNLCDMLGVDGKKVGELLKSDPRVGKSAMLNPGLGFAGGTLARDMQTLRRLGNRFKIPLPLIEGAWTANVEQNRQVLRKLERVLPQLRGAKIAVLGLTYKADTSTLRRSAAMEVIADLVAAGVEVTAHDPRADREELKSYRDFVFRENLMDAVDGADALILMTPWEDYKVIDFNDVKRRMKKPYVLDTAGLWNADDLSRLGFVYDAIGRGRQAPKVSL